MIPFLYLICSKEYECKINRLTHQFDCESTRYFRVSHLSDRLVKKRLIPLLDQNKNMCTLFQEVILEDRSKRRTKAIRIP